jgi:hypothetical protein
MNWKKFLLIGLAVSALAFAAAPRAEAGISVSFGFDPYGYYRCAPAYYPYGYNDYYGPRRVVYVGPRHYRNHYRYSYYPRRHHRHWR